jgi:hypothetical protein
MFMALDVEAGNASWNRLDRTGQDRIDSLDDVGHQTKLNSSQEEEESEEDAVDRQRQAV